MNAVKIIQAIEQRIDRNHTLLIRFGGLFIVTFLTIYVPFSMVNQVNQTVIELEAKNSILTSQLEAMSHEVEFLNLSYEKKQAIMQEVQCLAKNIYFEAGTESQEGKLAVAQVTINRAGGTNRSRSVCSVVYQKTKGICQFSWVCEGKGTPQNNKNWNQSVKIAESILIKNKKFNVVGQAKYFHATYVDPAWSETKQLVKQIGNHVFYK